MNNKQDIKNFYQKTIHSEKSPYFSLKLKKLKQFIPKNKTILDYGCGNGEITEALAKENKVIGVDISKKAITECKKRKLNCFLIKKNKLPVKNNFFDYIFLLETIEHIFDTQKLLKEIHRVLKPRGTLIVSIPNIAQLSNRIRFLFDLKIHYVETKPESGHIRFFTKNSLKKLLKENNFKIIKITASYIFLPILNIYYTGKILNGLGTELIFEVQK